MGNREWRHHIAETTPYSPFPIPLFPATFAPGMTEFFASIEQSPLSIWMREDLYAYFYVLIFHSLGMALLIGGGIIVCLRVLGLAANTRIEKFRGFFPVMWFGAALAIPSGVLLLVGYPAKALTNPLFGLKLAFLVLGALVLRELGLAFAGVARGEPMPDWVRGAAALVLLLWLIAVAAGKLLLHTYTILLVS